MRNTYIYCTGKCNLGDKFTLINAREALSIVKSNLVIIVDNDNRVDNYELFKIMYKVVSKENKVFLLGVGLEDAYAKNIYCLAVAKSIYNIYNVDDMDTIDEEYIDYIISKDNTLQDIENYIGSDVVFSETIGTILLEIINKCNEKDDDGLLEYIKMNVDILKNSVYYNDCMRSLNDKLASDVETAKGERDAAIKELNESKKNERVLQESNKKLEGNLQVFKKDMVQLKQENESLVSKLNKGGPIVSSFQMLHTGTLAKCKTKAILYFKEVTYVRYVNSLIMSLQKMLSQAQSHLKVRVLIYDNKNDFSVIYKPMNIVTLHDYLNNKDRLLNTDAMVVVEPSHVIIEDILKMDHDLLIVYDRLRLSKDLVHGNNVFKYWVVNSLSNYNEIKGEIIDTKYVITRPGVLEKSIAIPEIQGYSSLTDSAKLYKYRALANASAEPNGLIVENILQRAGIRLPRRG